MHNSYTDIRALTDREPTWWDENGVPRYAPFRPDLCPDIYADEAVLLLIACQNCRTRFKVAMTDSASGRAMRAARAGDPLSVYQDAIDATMADALMKGHGLHYGDPPNSGCCAAGPTMNCEDLAVLEYWHRDRQTGREWVRDGQYEIRLDYEEERDDEREHL